MLKEISIIVCQFIIYLLQLAKNLAIKRVSISILFGLKVAFHESLQILQHIAFAILRFYRFLILFFPTPSKVILTGWMVPSGLKMRRSMQVTRWLPSRSSRGRRW